MSDRHSKTEFPTPKRLRDAKKKGQVAKSSELYPAVSLMVFAMGATFLGEWLMKQTSIFLKNSLSTDFMVSMTSAEARLLLSKGIVQFFAILLPFGLLSLFLALGVNLFQVGFLFTAHPIKPDFKRINPLEGMKNIFSKKSLFNLFKSLAKLIMVAYLAYGAMKDFLPAFLGSGSLGTEKLFPFFSGFLKETVMDIGWILLGLAVVDYVFQRREFHNNLKMTKQEIKDEHKEMEGNPQIRQARQQRQRQIAMSRMMSAIKKADVVITNPTHLAVAMGYDPQKDSAPVVLAKGADHLASRIRAQAKDHNIPIMENKELARAIYGKADVGESIPMELYQAVAEILALVYRIKESEKKKYS